MPFYQCDPEIEITGAAALSLVHNIQHNEIVAILEEYGFGTVDPECWYPLQEVLNVLHDIGGGDNAMTNFVGIGISAGELGIENLPSEMRQVSMVEFLAAYRHIYKTRHRNGRPGDVIGEQVTENHVTITWIDTPYPDDLMYGAMYAYARHFLAGKSFTLRYDSNLHRDRHGGDITVMHLEWN